MKPSDDPRSPFNPEYKAKIDWKKQQLFQTTSETATKKLEKNRMKNSNFDMRIGGLVGPKDSLLPKKFHVYTRAGSPK